MAIRTCKAYLCIVYMLLSGQVFARQQDVVAMDVAGNQITASEIQHAYQKHVETGNQGSLQDFVENYLDTQLKALYAVRHGMDTLPAVRDEYAAFERSLLYEFLTDSVYLDSLRRLPQQGNGAGDVTCQERFLIVDIHVPVLQKNPDVTEAAGKADSIYRSLSRLADGGRMLTCHADTLCVGQYDVLPSFHEHLKHMKENVWNAPVAVEDGYHVVKLIKRLSASDDLLSWKLSRRSSGEDNDRMLAFLAGLKKLQSLSAQPLSADTFWDTVVRRYPEVASRLKECKTHLLAFEAVGFFRDSISSMADSEVLSSHFKKNKKRFQWKVPRFKGVLVVAPNKYLADWAVKVVSRCRNQEAARTALNSICGAEVSKTIALRFGIFQKGDDDYIDEKIYGVSSSGESDSPFCKVIRGKLLKRPASYLDDEETVRQDYLAIQESLWIQSLRQEYPHSVFWDTLNKYQ